MNNYIDMHSHILDGIDDGSRSIEESVEIIKKLSKMGFTGVVATPHYIEGSSYNANNSIKKSHIDDLRSLLKKEQIPVTIYLGNEIFICENIDSLVKMEEIHSINCTNYLLIELPFEQEISSLNEYLFRLRSMGYKIIIAHPERYKYFQKYPEMLEEYLDMGILFQCNYGSIIGRYGACAKKAMQTFLKNGYVSILSSDVHRTDGTFFEDFLNAKKKIIKLIGKKKFRELSYNNIYKVLLNKKVDEMVLC